MNMDMTEQNRDKPFLILASKSARRRYLLKQAGLSFSVIPSGFDESSVTAAAPEEYVRILAESKAKDISKKYSESWVIGADTVVVIDGKILGKPSSRTDARAMLKSLSGQTHVVLTGYCICCASKEILFSDTVRTEVIFKELSEDEIEWYIHTKEPFDKAGAYAIQGLGTFLVKGVNGSYTNVVGLPVCEVIEFLIKEGILGFDALRRINNRQ
jgi:septum formation protein